MNTGHALQELDAAANAVRGLLRDSEGEFLEVGRELTDLVTEADGIVARAQDALTAAEVAVGSDIGSRINAGVETIRDIVRQSQEAAGQSGQRLLTLKRALGRVDRFAGEFRRIVLSLRSLGLLTRMEGSRQGLEGSGFLTVSADVTALSDVIQDRFQTLVDRSGPLRQLLLDAAEANRKDEGTNLRTLDQVDGAVERLLDMNRQAHAHMARVGEAMQDIAAAFGRVVVSLQSHDITRQQLEHVAEVLEETCERGPDVDDEEAADVAELQRHQVRHARDSIMSAVDELTGGLRGLGRRMRQVESEMGSATSDSAPLLQSLEKRLMGALDVLRAGARRTATIATSTDEVASIVAEMSGFIHDIENISAQVNLIAFNAIVRSARTGEQGRAIGVLAQEIQAVAATTQAQTDAASAALSSVASEAASLQEAMRTLLAEGASRADAVGDELRTLLGQLASADEALAEGLTRVSLGSRALEARVERAAASITYHKRAQRVLDPVEARLSRLASASLARLDPDARLARSERLAAALSRYTMESERQVHALALGGADDGSAFGGGSASGPDLGTNVELF